MSKHLFTRNGRYYFRQWLPLDLRYLFGNKSDIAKSLKTSDKKEAITLSVGLQQKYRVAFTMIRTGSLSPEMVAGLIASTFPCTPSKSIQPHTAIAKPTDTPRDIVGLSTCITLFMEDQHRVESANSSTLVEYSAICQLFLRIVGDIPVDEISRDTLRSYLDTLKQLPPHINKKKQYKGKTIQEIIAMNAGGLTLATATIEKTLTLIKTMFAWLLTEGVIDKNPSDVLKAPKRDLRPDEERKAYTSDDLQKLLEGLKAEAVKGKLKDHPERYWLPLIALFSGMRLNEIAQLHVGDVVQVKGIWCFKVQAGEEGGKKIKTAASNRVIPVHQTLIDLGLIAFVEAIKKAGHPRLWMRLTLDSKGKWGKNFSNWFLGVHNYQGFLRAYVTKDDKKDFHSFRHTFINTLKQSDVDEVKIAELVGHVNPSITTGRYGKRHGVEKMKKTVDLIGYKGVDFLGIVRMLTTLQG